MGKREKNISYVFMWIWIISWFLSIWIKSFQIELLATGAFSFILGLLFNGVHKEIKKFE